MDSLYSLSLLASLACGGFAVFLTLVEQLPAFGIRISWLEGKAKVLARCVATLATVAFVALMVSFLVHMRWGHGPGSAEPLAFEAFLRAHRAFFVAGVLVLAATILHAFRPKPG